MTMRSKRHYVCHAADDCVAVVSIGVQQRLNHLRRNVARKRKRRRERERERERNKSYAIMKKNEKKSTLDKVS